MRDKKLTQLEERLKVAEQLAQNGSAAHMSSVIVNVKNLAKETETDVSK